MLFSIVIPVYNAEAYLPRCLDSIRSQTDQDCEVIVVDDFSPGNCADVVKPYGDLVRYIRHAENRSAFQARRTGIEAAQGDYIVPVDPDDYLVPETLARLREVIDRDAPDMISYWIDYDDGTRVYPHWCRHRADTVSGEEALRDLAAGGYFTGVASKAFRRETLLDALRELDAPDALYVNTCDDFLMLVPMLMKSGRVSFLDFAGYRYFVNGESTTFSWRTRRGFEKALAQMKLANGLILRMANRPDVPTDVRLVVERTVAGLESWFVAENRSMTRISKESSEKVVFWSFVFSAAVVVIHCGWTAETSFGRLAIALFKDTFARMAVPFFFACSGFFLAPRLEGTGGWRREFGKRIFSLGIPYLVWTLVLAGVMYFETREWIGIGGFGFNLTQMPGLSPLWYVRCLMIFVVLSPVFKCALDRFRWRALLLSYGALFVFYAVVLMLKLPDEGGIAGFFNFGLSLDGLFYFLCGMYLSRLPRVQLTRKQAAMALAGGILLIAVRLGFVYAGVKAWVDVRNLITPLVLVGLWGCFSPPALPSVLRGCAYPIYLMHVIVLSAMRFWGGAYHTCNPWLEFVLGLTLPMVFCNVLRRFCPPVASLLYGGRI